MYTSLFINDLRDFLTQTFEKRNSMKTQNGENIMDQTDSDQNSVVDEDSNALAPALTEESTRTVQEIVSKHGLKVILIQTLIILVAIIIIGLQGYWLHQKKTKYIATNGGMITEVHPTDEPAYTAEEVMDFANRTMIKSLSLNFVNYENQLTSVRGDFSAEGYVSFRKALTDSGLLKDISEKRLNVKLSTTPGTLITEGLIRGTKTYAWQYRIPVTVQLVGQAQDYRPQPYDLMVQVRRVKEDEDPRGIQVAQAILKPRNY
ncbi:TPA: DotI/IcmL/TraM family protein [Enterobacter hormaechei subsp. hormaechei]|nr:DotI/IcmL/TraM family protein [Escherichia coli]HDS5007598.1 DotI/IcmL/TraM family protein [Enterobacter hormaechei subsp. hoffmannii]HDS5021634.1 DotI/IcmL/TraM family protein [Enterobacter hormaechei subsp. hormaechei]